MEILPAAEEDLADIQAIYAHHVLNGTGSFEEVPPALEEMIARFRANQEAGHAWLVARDASGCLGFGYYGPFRARAAYRTRWRTACMCARGCAARASARPSSPRCWNMRRRRASSRCWRLIGDSENAGSIGVHASLGFLPVGTLRKVGYKFDRWLDVVMMQKTL